MIKVAQTPGGYTFTQDGKTVGLLLEAPLCWVAYRQEGNDFEVAPFDCRGTLGAWQWILEEHLPEEHVELVHELWIRGDDEVLEVKV